MMQQECRQCVRPVVVGISGPSRSGKTTLVAEWQARCGAGRACGVVHQDLFFARADDAPSVEVTTDTGQSLVITNWEVPEAIRWPDMIAEVKRLMSHHTIKCGECRAGGDDSDGAATMAEQTAAARKPQVVFVEGFIVFADRELVGLMDKRVLVLIGHAEARRRRLGTSGTTGFYFDRFVWPHCVAYARDVLSKRRQDGDGDGAGVVEQAMLVLSGEDGVSDNVQRLAAFVDGDSGEGRQPMTDGAARLIQQQLRTDTRSGEGEERQVAVECESSERAALKLYREAEVLEAYGKRTEATALYRRALRMWPGVEEAAGNDDEDGNDNNSSG